MKLSFYLCPHISCDEKRGAIIWGGWKLWRLKVGLHKKTFRLLGVFVSSDVVDVLMSNRALTFWVRFSEKSWSFWSIYDRTVKLIIRLSRTAQHRSLHHMQSFAFVVFTVPLKRGKFWWRHPATYFQLPVSHWFVGVGVASVFYLPRMTMCLLLGGDGS